MAGSATFALNKIFHAGKKIHEIVCDWSSPDTGTVSVGIGAGLVTALRLSAAKISGKIISLETSPGYLGDIATLCPDDQYDMQITDAYGCDILPNTASLGNRSSSAAETIIYSTPIPVNSELTLGITNTGTPTKGRLIITVDPK
jgi:hypothetical protein